MSLDEVFNFSVWTDAELEAFVNRLYTSQMERELQNMARREIERREREKKLVSLAVARRRWAMKDR